MTQAANQGIRRPSISPSTIAIGIVVVIGAILLSVAGLYTDVLWFDQLGFLSVLSTQIFAQSAVQRFSFGIYSDHRIGSLASF